MWVVKDADTTIYLFGTFHALDGKRDWFNDEVQAGVRRVAGRGAGDHHARRSDVDMLRDAAALAVEHAGRRR